VKKTNLAVAISLLCMSATVFAQIAQKGERIEVTGSNIKRIQAEGALPIQIISRQDIERAGIQSAEDPVIAPRKPPPATSAPPR